LLFGRPDAEAAVDEDSLHDTTVGRPVIHTSNDTKAFHERPLEIAGDVRAAITEG
jgi:hypothetical protein